MAVPQDKLYMTVEEYLEFEKTSKVRHEYVDGQVFPMDSEINAMAGESKRHNRIASRIFRFIDAHLEESDCEVYIEAVKLRVNSSKFYYPDVVVIYEADLEDDEYVLENPRLIVEVLSPSTERTDRAEKLLAYQRMSSLQEYVIVAQDRIWVQIHQRQSGDNWTVENYLDLNDEITFASVNFTIGVSDIYRNISFAPLEGETE